MGTFRLSLLVLFWQVMFDNCDDEDDDVEEDIEEDEEKIEEDDG